MTPVCEISYEQTMQILSAPFITVLKKVQTEIAKHGIKSSLRLAVSGRKKGEQIPIAPVVPFGKFIAAHSIAPTPFPYNQKALSEKYILGFPGIFGTNLFVNINGTKTRLWYEATDSLFVSDIVDICNPPEGILTGPIKRIVLSVPYDLLQKKWKHYVITEFKDFADVNQYDPDNIAKIAVNLIMKIYETNEILNKECQYVVYERKMPKNCSLEDFLVLQRKP